MSRRYIQECVGLIHLLGGHDLGELFAAVDARLVASGDSARVPGIGRDVVEGNAFALFEKKAHAGFRGRQARASGEAHELRGVVIVPRQSDAIEIKISEVQPRFR